MPQNNVIGAVVIGRNEGVRLERCLISVLGECAATVYVDSGSTDGSIALAKSLGVEVVELDCSEGFTAAMARNAGLRRIIELLPSASYVQFMDGDCMLVSGWIDAAAAFLDANRNVAMVGGRRREVYPEKNLYHRLADIEWNTPIGDARYCGGDALMLIDALKEVGAFRESLIAGEEPELCVRLRKAGWRVFRYDHDMTLHDIRMDSWQQWWKRAVRSGHAFAEGVAIHGAPPERHWVKERRSIAIWGLALPGTAILLAAPTVGVSLGLLAIAYSALVAKVTIGHEKHTNDSLALSFLYGCHCTAAKIPQAIGLLSFYSRRLAGSSPRPIEYKATGSSPPLRSTN